MNDKKEWESVKWEAYLVDQDEIVDGELRKYYIRDPVEYRYKVVEAVISSSPDGMDNPEELHVLAGRSYVLEKKWIDIKKVLGGPKLWIKSREELRQGPGELG